MTIHIDALIIMPVGPNSRYEFINDTIESIIHYIDEGRFALLIVNDSGKDDFHQSIRPTTNTIIYDVPANLPGTQQRNTLGNLFAKQTRALMKASDHYDWKCVLRLDDDALITGPNPQDDALAEFNAHPRIGMLGAYHFRGDGTNKDQAMAEKGRVLLRTITKPRGAKRFARSLFLAHAALRAKFFGYKMGDMCTGGSLFISRKACDHIIATTSKKLELFEDCKLDDDLLLSLFVSSGAMKLGDFSKRDQIMAINWRGLPMPLEELVARQKKVLHPVKDPQDPQMEIEVRAFFRAQRKNKTPGRVHEYAE